MLKFVVLFLLGTSALAVPTDTNIPGTSVPASAVPVGTNPPGTSVPSSRNQNYPPWLAVLVGKPAPSVVPITHQGQDHPPAWLRHIRIETASTSPNPEPVRPNSVITGTSAQTSTNRGDAGTSFIPSPKRSRPNFGTTGTAAPTRTNTGDASTSSSAPGPGGVQRGTKRPFPAALSYERYDTDTINRELEELKALRDYDDVGEMAKALETQLINRKFVMDQASAKEIISQASKFKSSMEENLWEFIKTAGSRKDFQAALKDARHEVNFKYGGDAQPGYVDALNMDWLIFSLLAFKGDMLQTRRAFRMINLATSYAVNEARMSSPPIPEGPMRDDALVNRIKEILPPQYQRPKLIRTYLGAARKMIATSPDTGVDIDNRLINALTQLVDMGTTPQEITARDITEAVEKARWVTMTQLAARTNKVAALSRLLENPRVQLHMLTKELICNGEIETLKVVLQFKAYNDQQYRSAIDVADQTENTDALATLLKDENAVRHWVRHWYPLLYRLDEEIYQ